VGAGGGRRPPLHPPPCVCVCVRGCVCEGIVLSCAIGLVCYRVGALSGLCAIYFVCYRDVGYRVGELSGIVSIFRVLSGWCAIAPCANGTRSNRTTLACLLYPTRHKLTTSFNNLKTKLRTKFCQRKNRLRIDSRMCHFKDNRVNLNHHVYISEGLNFPYYSR